MPTPRSCPICIAAEFIDVERVIASTHTLDIVVCTGCGLVYVNPMLTNAEKDAVCPAVRQLHRSRAFEKTDDSALAHAQRRLQRCIDLITPHVRAGAEVLEIGSGDGAMLRFLKDIGARPTGIDIDAASAASMREAIGVPILAGAFEDIEFHGKKFDAVVLVHLIEHFFEPVAMLRRIRDLLKPGGWVFVETPNIMRPKVGPRRVFSLAHNYHFSPRTLALAFHKAGFACTALREFRRDSIQIVAHAAADAALPLPMVEPWQEVIAAIKRYQRRYLTTGQFIWRKLPWFKERLMYQPRRMLSGMQLRDWLVNPRIRFKPDGAPALVRAQLAS